MKLMQLEMFVAMVEEGSFRRAAAIEKLRTLQNRRGPSRRERKRFSAHFS